jgi:hypothetical protein
VHWSAIVGAEVEMGRSAFPGGCIGPETAAGYPCGGSGRSWLIYGAGRMVVEKLMSPLLVMSWLGEPRKENGRVASVNAFTA